MIINKPTGLYKDLLPSGPSDAGSVVFTVSSLESLQQPINPLQIPAGVAVEGNVELQDTAVGQLVALTKTDYGHRAAAGNRQFYAGQVLEFADAESTSEIDLRPAGIDLQYDQFYVSSDNIGLEDEEFEVVESEVRSAHEAMLVELASLQRTYNELQAEIETYQKIISEANKAVAAIDVVLGRGSPNTVVSEAKEKIIARRTEAETNMNEAIEKLQSVSQQIDDIKSELRDLAVLME